MYLFSFTLTGIWRYLLPTVINKHLVQACVFFRLFSKSLYIPAVEKLPGPLLISVKKTKLWLSGFQEGGGLTALSPRHINWKGMKCQACSHRRETPETLPPPPTPPPQQPPTAVTKLFSSLQRFASPDKNLQRSPDSVHKHAASLLSQRLSAATLKKMGLPFFSLFFNGPPLGQLCLFTLDRFKRSQKHRPQNNLASSMNEGQSKKLLFVHGPSLTLSHSTFLISFSHCLFFQQVFTLCLVK